MTLTFDRLTFQLSKSEEQPGSLSNVALSTLFCNPFRSFLVNFCQNLPLTLNMTLTSIGGAISNGYMYAYWSVLIFTIKSCNINDTVMQLQQYTNS